MSLWQFFVVMWIITIIAFIGLLPFILLIWATHLLLGI